MQYQEAVIEFRRLDDEIEADQWRQAELVWEQVQAGASRLSLARDTRKDDKHIGVLYRVWDRHGSVPAPNRSVTFADAYRMAETSADTPEEASAIKNVNRASSALGQLPRRARAEVIREIMKDPDVADEVMAVRDTRRDAIAAVSRVHEREDLTRERPEPQPETGTTDPEQEMVLTLVDFRRVQRILTEITQRLQRSTMLRGNRDYQDAVLAQVAWDRNALELIETVTNGGETTDEALARILDGGAA